MSSSRRADTRQVQLRRLRHAHALAQVGDGAFYVTSAAYLVASGWSPTRVGALLGVCWGVGALLSRRIGALADRRGLVPIGAVTVTCCAVGLLGLASADGAALVAVSFLLYATAQSAWGGVRAALAQAAAGPTAVVVERARLQSIGNGAVALGTCLGGLALALGGIAAMRTAVAADAAVYLAAAFLIGRLNHGLTPSSPAAGSPSLPDDCLRMTPARVVATVAASALYLYMPMLSVALPLLITRASNVPSWTISACFLANTVGVMALQRRVAAHVTTARRTRQALLIGGILLAVSSALLWTTLQESQTAPAFIALGLAVGVVSQVFGEVRFAAGAWDLGYRLAPASGVAAWQATYGAAIPIARSVGPAILAPLANVESGWIVPALLFLAGATATAAVTPTSPAPDPIAQTAAAAIPRRTRAHFRRRPAAPGPDPATAAP